MSDDAKPDVTSLTVQLLSAYLSNNTVASEDLAGLIATTRAALGATESRAPTVEEATYEPAVTARKSTASREHIISMIDGKPYKMLKRHLALHGLTPAEYKARYNLPSDYPMVAAAYSDRRREVAKTAGLGRKDRDAAVESPTLPVEASAETKPEIEAPKSASKPAPKAKSGGKVTAKAASAPKPGIVKEPVAVVAPKAPRKAKAETAAEVLPVGEPAVAPEVTSAIEPKASPKKAEAKTKAAPKPKTAARVSSKPAAKKSGKVTAATDALAAAPDAGESASAADGVAASEASKPAPKSRKKAPAKDKAASEVAKPVRAKRMARAPEPATQEAAPASEKTIV